MEAVGCSLSQLRAPSMFWEFLVGQPRGHSPLPFRCAQAFQHPLPSAFPIPVDAPSPHGHQGASGPPPHHLLSAPGPGCPASPVRQLRPPHGSLQAAHPQPDEAPPGPPLFLKPSLPPGAPEGAAWPTMSHTYSWLCVPDTTLFLPPGSLCLESIPQSPPGFPELGRSPHPVQGCRHSAAAPGCPPHPLQPASFPPQPPFRPCRAVPSTGNTHSPLGRDDSHSTWRPTTTSSQKPSSHALPGQWLSLAHDGVLWLGRSGHIGRVPVRVQRDARLLSAQVDARACITACRPPALHTPRLRVALPAHAQTHLPLCARVHSARPGPRPSPRTAPSPHSPPPHTRVAHTARRARSLMPSPPPSLQQAPSYCLPPLPASVFAKQFPWRHILALTGTSAGKTVSTEGTRLEVSALRLPGRHGGCAPLSRDAPPTLNQACTPRRKFRISSCYILRELTLVIQSFNKPPVLSAVPGHGPGS